MKGCFAALLGIALGTCLGCHAAVTKSPTPTPPDSLVAAEHERAVEVGAWCTPAPDDGGKAGSGARIASRRVLTALHVVNCAPRPDDDIARTTQSPYLIMVQGSGNDAQIVEARIVVALVDRDLAVLELAADVVGTDAEFGPPPIPDEIVCDETAWPSRSRACGTVVQALGYDPLRGMSLQTTLHVEAGNSGSAIYDGGGHLVGVVTRANGSGSLVWPVVGAVRP